MLYLFQLRCDKEVRLLPIAEQTAALLERALLVGEHDDCRAFLSEALRNDPFLALTVMHESANLSEDCQAFGSAVNWLAESTATKLSRLLSVPLDQGMRLSEQSARRIVKVVQQALFSLVNGGDAPSADSDAYWQAVVRSKAKLIAACPCDNLGKPRTLPTFSPVAPVLRLTKTASRSQSIENRIQSSHVESPSEFGAGYLLQEIGDIDWRLPALIKQLASTQLDRAAFESRLETEKLKAMRELAYGASHEINNPLANIAARAQTLLRDEQAPDRRKKLSAINNQAMRAHEMIADLMLFAHPPQLDTTQTNITDLLKEVVAELTPQAVDQRIDVRFAANYASCETLADPTQLAVALRAVIVNSLEAIGNDGIISIELEQSESQLAIVISDNGPGIPAEVRRHIFDPFYSGREAGRGHGFGLSKCWQVIHEHGGTIHVFCPKTGGSKFTLRLPLAKTENCDSADAGPMNRAA